MLIVLQHGSRFDEVVDMTPIEARAMLADGRATLPVSEPAAGPSVVSTHVVARADRVPAHAKRRATR